jgi:hypothetical protein
MASVRNRLLLVCALGALFTGMAVSFPTDHWLPASAASRAAAPETIQFAIKLILTDVPASPAVGSGFVLAGDLFDKTGAAIGHGMGACAVTEINQLVPTAFCAGNWRFTGPQGKGDVSVTAVFPIKVTFPYSFSVAAVGGTGDYARDRGDGTITATGVGTFDVTLTLYQMVTS